MATATAHEEPPVHRGTLSTWLSEVFQLNATGLHWARGVMVLDVLLVPLVVFWTIGHDQYLLSAIVGVMFTAVLDPGGSYGNRAWSGVVFALIGAAVTALGFGLGGAAWGWLAFAAFAVTLVAGLGVAFGARRFVGAYLLNLWFIIALAAAFGLHQTRVTSHTWGQVLAWTAGSALWIAVTFVAWLIRGRNDEAQPIAELPADTARHQLTPPVITFAALRALVMAGTTALAFGLNLTHGLWLPIAAIVAMKPSLEQSTVTAVQRLAGAVIGAVAAALLLLLPASEHGLRLVSITFGLETVAIVLFMHAAAIRFWNYAFYTSAIAAAVLVLLDLPHPSDYAAEGYRVLWTLCGVAIGVIVMLLAGLLAKATAKPALTPAARPSTQPA
jgi:hypothetical protein